MTEHEFAYMVELYSENCMKYVVPMYESERGWGSKIDGYAGPFDSLGEATAFRDAYNEHHNSEDIVPDWYIVAQPPVVFTNQTCNYKVDV